MKRSLSLFIIITLLVSIPFFFPNTSSVAQSPSINLQMVSANDDAFPKMSLVFSVSDPSGLPIKDLEKQDFSFSEDNKAIDAFTISPLVNTEMPLAVALVLDTSGSMTGSLPNAVQAAKDFIATLGPNDQVALIAFKEKPVVVQELTTDHALLTPALNGLSAVGDSAMFDSVIEAIEVLKPRTERKVIILITDGYETGISSFDFNQVIDEAVRWSTHVYPIGIGGVQQANLEQLAKLTGGFAQINPDSSALSGAFGNLLENLRNQYKLEYTSSLTADGTEHAALVTYKYQNGSASDDTRFVAKPGSISVSFPDISEGQEISGNVRFSPIIVAPSPVKQIDFSVDNKLVTSMLSAPFEYLWNSSLVDIGIHSFDFAVIDQVGNTATHSLNLNVVPPVSVSSNLTADQVLSGKFTIPLEVKASRGIANVEFFVDGKKVAEDKELPYEIEWDTKSVVPGYHALRFVATDLEQNVGESQLRVNVEIQKSNNLLWVALLTLLIAMGIIIPIATRKNRSNRKSSFHALPINGDGVQNPSLIEREGFEPGHVWQLKGSEIRLGRKRDENDIMLKGLSASRFHAVINLTPNGATLKSLNPENPAYVNDQPIIDELLLQNGDVIKAGESEFLFEA